MPPRHHHIPRTKKQEAERGRYRAFKGEWNMFVSSKGLFALTVAAGISMAGLTAIKPASAQQVAYPVNTVTLVTLSSPGGGTDVFLREVIKHLGPIMGVNFVIENVVGGGGARAMSRVAQGPADGSIFIGTTGTLVNTTLVATVEHGARELDWVVNFFLDAPMAYVRADSPFQTFQDVIDYAVGNPGGLNYGLATPTSQDRYAVERLQELLGVQINAVPFDGGGDLLINVLNGTLDVANGEPQELMPQLEAGEIRILAAYTPSRVAAMPDVPTAKELGVDLEVIKFRGLAGPKGLPSEIHDKWLEATKLLLEVPEFKDWYEKGGLVALVLDHAEYESFIADFTDVQEKFFRGIGVLQ